MVEIRHHRSAVPCLIGCFTSVIARSENSGWQKWNQGLSDHQVAFERIVELFCILFWSKIHQTDWGFVCETASLICMNAFKYEFPHVWIFSYIWILYWRENWIIQAHTKAYKTGFRGASKHEVCVLSRADVGSIKLVALVWASTWLGSIRAVSLVWAWECTTWLAWMLLKGGTLRVPTKLTQSKKKTNQ